MNSDIFENGGLCGNCQAPLDLRIESSDSYFVRCEYCKSIWKIPARIETSGWYFSSSSACIVSYEPINNPSRNTTPAKKEWFK